MVAMAAWKGPAPLLDVSMRIVVDAMELENKDEPEEDTKEETDEENDDEDEEPWRCPRREFRLRPDR